MKDIKVELTKNSVSTIKKGTSDSIHIYNQLNVYDWLSNISLSQLGCEHNLVEVKFKGGRKDFFINQENLNLKKDDLVVVEAETGYDIGHVSLTGELVRLQLKNKNIEVSSIEKKIQRELTNIDIIKWEESKNLEDDTMLKARLIAKELGLIMKICDVDYQGDQSKATFYYTAYGRIDFRELVKVLAIEFKIKIAMRQINVFEEARRIGGIGMCGREYCYSTWLSNVKKHKNTLKNQNSHFKCCMDVV